MSGEKAGRRRRKKNRSLSGALSALFLLALYLLLCSTLPLETRTENYLPFFDRTLTVFVCDQEIYSKDDSFRGYRILCGRPAPGTIGTDGAPNITIRYRIVSSLYLAVLATITYFFLWLCLLGIGKAVAAYKLMRY